MKIGIFDSGIGGTTIMNAIKKLLPNEEYFYFADSLNCPYGNKTTKELQKVTEKATEKLINWGAEIIVVACNTATVKCIDHLRERYPEVDFVGTEPAVKVATKSKAKNIIVLATPGTIRSERLEKAVAESKKTGQSITLIPCKNLATDIEACVKLDKNYQPLPLDIDEELVIRLSLLTILMESDFKQGHVDPDAIVLGCTHYPLISRFISETFRCDNLIDGSDGVAHQVERLVKEKQTA